MDDKASAGYCIESDSLKYKASAKCCTVENGFDERLTENCISTKASVLTNGMSNVSYDTTDLHLQENTATGLCHSASANIDFQTITSGVHKNGSNDQMEYCKKGELFTAIKECNSCVNVNHESDREHKNVEICVENTDEKARNDTVVANNHLAFAVDNDKQCDSESTKVIDSEKLTVTAVNIADSKTVECARFKICENVVAVKSNDSESVSKEPEVSHQPIDYSTTRPRPTVFIQPGTGPSPAQMSHSHDSLQNRAQKQDLKSDSFRPLGRLLHDLGLELVREQVYRDLIEIQMAKDSKNQLEEREKGQLIKLVEAREKLASRNAPYHLSHRHCVRCNYTSSSSVVLALHEQYGSSSRLDLSVYICCACGPTNNFRTRSASQFLAHMTVEHSITGRLIKKPAGFSCTSCPYEHKNYVRLEAHAAKCTRKFMLSTNLQPLPGDCDIPLVYRPGDRTTRAGPNLLLQSSAGIMSPTGQPCIQTLLNSLRSQPLPVLANSAQQPLPLHSSLICEICGKLIECREALWSHFRSAHHVELSRATMQNHDPWMKCDVCIGRFWTYQGLSRHLLLAHNRTIASGYSGNSSGMSPNTRCHLCGGSQTNNPLSHFSAYHNITLLEMYHAKMCCLCNRKLSSGRIFEEHMVELHSDIFANYDVLRTVLQALTAARFFKTDDARESSVRIMPQLSVCGGHYSGSVHHQSKHTMQQLSKSGLQSANALNEMSLHGSLVQSTEDGSSNNVDAETSGCGKQLMDSTPNSLTMPRGRRKRQHSSPSTPSVTKTPDKGATAEEVKKLYEDLADIGRPILRSMRQKLSLSLATIPSKCSPTDNSAALYSHNCDVDQQSVPTKQLCLGDIDGTFVD